MFQERVKRSPGKVAFQFFNKPEQRWSSLTWGEVSLRVAKYQAALTQDGLKPGERVAIMLNNSPEWAMFEQAALGLGLVVVPLYTNDRVDNISYVLQDAGIKVLLVEGHEHIKMLEAISSQIDGLTRLLSREPCKQYNRFSRLLTLEEWTALATKDSGEMQCAKQSGNDLATIVYTSGTTGRPKGVMLSHNNILSNAYSGGAKAIEIYTSDIFLSFLPLSHMLERTAGYYIPIMFGASIAFARSVQDLAEDLLSIKPTVLISVPRIYERVYNKIYAQLEKKSPLARGLFLKAVEAGWQRFSTGHSPLSWQLLKPLVANKVMAKLGGHLRIAICGGAPLSPSVAKTFVGLGLNLLQGYGLTETSPIIAVNRSEDNVPASVGKPLDGIEVKVGKDAELLVRGPCIMLGYWNNVQATEQMIDAEGWLHTGDKVKIEQGRIFITGRIKEIIVLSNGEKVPPNDMEMAITMDNLFEQALVLGEGRPYLSALLVLSSEDCNLLSAQLGTVIKDTDDLKNPEIKALLLRRVSLLTCEFPGYAQIKQISICTDPWSVENGLMTPTLKLKRQRILEKYAADVSKMYAGH